MGPHKDILWDVVNRFGVLEGVAVSQEDSSRPEEYELRFHSGVLLVAVNEADDTVRLGRDRSTLSTRIDVSTWEPWNRVIGYPAIWAWELQNQQGYLDALQIEFSLNPGFATIQLVCEASAIKALTVEDVGALSHPWK
jgi:hypothetical protein